MEESLKNLALGLKIQQEIMPFDFLGRSLSYNPYMPRSNKIDFKRETYMPKKALKISPFENLETIDFSEGDFIMIDFSLCYQKGIVSIEIFDYLGHLRRYSDKIIIHNDLFISEYQILQSVFYGSDCVILDTKLLGQNLKKIAEFAARLGLCVIVKVSNLDELKKAIFAKIDLIYITQDFSNLIKSTPNSKIIFSDLKNGEKINEKNSYGVDVFFIESQN